MSNETVSNVPVVNSSVLDTHNECSTTGIFISFLYPYYIQYPCPRDMMKLYRLVCSKIAKALLPDRKQPVNGEEVFASHHKRAACTTPIKLYPKGNFSVYVKLNTILRIRRADCCKDTATARVCILHAQNSRHYAATHAVFRLHGYVYVFRFGRSGEYKLTAEAPK